MGGGGIRGRTKNPPYCTQGGGVASKSKKDEAWTKCSRILLAIMRM